MSTTIKQTPPADGDRAFASLSICGIVNLKEFARGFGKEARAGAGSRPPAENENDHCPLPAAINIKQLPLHLLTKERGFLQISAGALVEVHAAQPETHADLAAIWGLKHEMPPRRPEIWPAGRKLETGRSEARN